MADDEFVPNEDDEWADDDDDGDLGDEAADEFPDDEKDAPSFSRGGFGAKTIFVTQQFRFFRDEYEVVGSIGEPGQFGIAYECYLKSDKEKRRRCAKEINKARFHHISVDKRNAVLATMQNEIAVLRKVSHPNIVALFDVYEDRHKLHLVM